MECSQTIVLCIHKQGRFLPTQHLKLLLSPFTPPLPTTPYSWVFCIHTRTISGLHCALSRNDFCISLCWGNTCVCNRIEVLNTYYHTASCCRCHSISSTNATNMRRGKGWIRWMDKLWRYCKISLCSDGRVSLREILKNVHIHPLILPI